MKKRHFALGAAIVLVAAILGASGTYLKYNILKPLGIYQDKSIFELPILMYTDEYLRFQVENAEAILQMQQGSSTTGTTAPTQPSTGATKPTGTTQTGSSSTETTTQDTVPTTRPSHSSSSTSGTESTPPVTTQPTTKPIGEDFYFPAGVEEEWFDRVLFIGDSRVVGLREYARSGNADYFCDVGMNLLSYDDKVLSDRTFSNLTLEELLSQRQYDKIIVNFGLNECGFNDYSFQMLYRNLVAMLQEKQPDAVIVLQGIMSVTKTKADTASYLEPSFIFQRSAYIASLCDGVKVHYIDCNPYFTDENGYLFTSITHDGYHPTVAGYAYWRNWMSYALGQLGI